MIELTKLNEKKLFINSDLMEFIESSPDTIITLTTGKKIIVKESASDVVSKIIDFKNRVFYDPSRIVKKQDEEK